MENILEKEPVKRVQDFITQFDHKLKVLVLDTTARTAKTSAGITLIFRTSCHSKATK